MDTEYNEYICKFLLLNKYCLLSGDMIEVMLDCESMHRRVVDTLDTGFLDHDHNTDLTVWLGQRNQDTSFLFQVKFD